MTKEEKVRQACWEFIDSKIGYVDIFNPLSHSEDLIIAANNLGMNVSLYTLFLARLSDTKKQERLERERKESTKLAIAAMKARFNK